MNGERRLDAVHARDVDELHDEVLDRLADRLAERLAPRLLEQLQPVRSPELVDAATLAKMLNLTREFVYDHADELGVRRIGGRLRFDPAYALRARQGDVGNHRSTIPLPECCAVPRAGAEHSGVDESERGVAGERRRSPTSAARARTRQGAPLLEVKRDAR